jgi:hypothetical protein
LSPLYVSLLGSPPFPSVCHPVSLAFQFMYMCPRAGLLVCMHWSSPSWSTCTLVHVCLPCFDCSTFTYCRRIISILMVNVIFTFLDLELTIPTKQKNSQFYVKPCITYMNGGESEGSWCMCSMHSHIWLCHVVTWWTK